MRQRGITLVEMLVGLAILMAVFSTLFITYITMQRLWRGGFTQIGFQSRGRVVLEGMVRELRTSTGATILDSGDRIRFVTDPNGTPQTEADDITCEYYLSTTNIIYDPDIDTAGDEVTVLRNVNKEGAIPVFQISGNLVVIAFKLLTADVVYGTSWSSMTTSVKLRNV